MTHEEAIDVASYLRGCYPLQRIPAEAVTAYSRAILDFDIADVMDAVADHVDRDKAFPDTPAEFKRLVRGFLFRRAQPVPPHSVAFINPATTAEQRREAPEAFRRQSILLAQLERIPFGTRWQAVRDPAEIQRIGRTVKPCPEAQALIDEIKRIAETEYRHHAQVRCHYAEEDQEPTWGGLNEGIDALLGHSSQRS